MGRSLSNDPRDVLPDRLAYWLSKRQMTASQLAWIIDVNPKAVDAWIDGLDFPCPRHMERLRVALSVTREELLCRS